MIIKADDKWLDKLYNIEYKLDCGKVCTVSGILSNIDKNYFYFDEPNNGGLIIIAQEAIRTLQVIQK